MVLVLFVGSIFGRFASLFIIICIFRLSSAAVAVAICPAQYVSLTLRTLRLTCVWRMFVDLVVVVVWCCRFASLLSIFFFPPDNNNKNNKRLLLIWTDGSEGARHHNISSLTNNYQ